MAEQKTLDKNYTVQGGVVVIVETVQKTLSRTELESEKLSYLSRITQLNNQIQQFIAERTNMQTAVLEIDKMLTEMPTGE